MRTTHPSISSSLPRPLLLSLLLSLLLVGGLAVAGCGDGIDERTAALAPQQGTATTTTAPEVVELPTFELDEVTVAVGSTNADYSGARSALHLADGTWLVTGYDNHSDFRQPEPGAVWRGDDLRALERTGDGISDENGQQGISSLVELASGRIVAVGTDFSRDDPEAEFVTYDAAVWLSDDKGGTFRIVPLRLEATAAGALVVDGTIYVHGYQFGEGDEGLATGQIWRSDDDGETWAELDPMVTPKPGSAPAPLGTIEKLLQWDDSLIAVGRTTATDPDGGDYPLDRYSLSSSTEEWEPVDVGLWYSDDLGATWHAAAAQGLSGQRNAQVASNATVVGDQLVIVGAASENSDSDFEFNPEDFNPEDFNPEDFNPEDFNPEDFNLEDFNLEDLESFSTSALVVPTIWTCDYLLARCDAVTVDTEGSDFVGGILVQRNGFALVAFSAYISDSEGGQQLLAFHPLSGEYEAIDLPGSFAQTSAIVLDGDRLVLFGRHARLDELDVLVASIND